MELIFCAALLDALQILNEFSAEWERSSAPLTSEKTLG